jgi:transcription elongation factor GreA
MNMPYPKTKFTKVGFEKINKRFQFLTDKRPEAVNRLQIARELGDLSENGAYKAARFEVSSIDRELRHLTRLIQNAQIVESTQKDFVDFGSVITLESGKDKLSFTLVGKYEADPVNKQLSTYSPIGRAVLGKRLGDKITVNAPSGEITYTVIEIK